MSIDTDLPWAYTSVFNERKRQDLTWGEKNHDDATWLAILTKNTGEVAKTMQHANQSTTSEHAQARAAHLRADLVQVAAVAVAWIEELDRMRDSNL